MQPRTPSKRRTVELPACNIWKRRKHCICGRDYRKCCGTRSTREKINTKVRKSSRWLPGPNHAAVRSFFRTLLAFKHDTKLFATSVLSKDPFANCHWRIVPNVLAMAAGQNGSPVSLVIHVEINDLLFHSFPHVTRAGSPR